MHDAMNLNILRNVQSEPAKNKKADLVIQLLTNILNKKKTRYDRRRETSNSAHVQKKKNDSNVRQVTGHVASMFNIFQHCPSRTHVINSCSTPQKELFGDKCSSTWDRRDVFLCSDISTNYGSAHTSAHVEKPTLRISTTKHPRVKCNV